VKPSASGRALRLGTRGSDLALTQSRHVAESLRAAGADVELRTIRTAGDRSDAPSFAAIGPQGVFVREIEQALLGGDIDLAVHSFKDLPTRSPDGLVVAAVPPRADAADVLLVRRDALDDADGGLLPLRRAAKVGTASARRIAWLEHYRADLDIASLRGNVPTRIRRLNASDYDAIVLAAAGLERLEAVPELLDTLLDAIEIIRLKPSKFVPAPAQGALAVQCRRDDTRVLALLEQLDDAETRTAIGVERAVLEAAEGGCEIAFGAYCRAAPGGYELTAMLERGGRVGAIAIGGREPESLGVEAWEALSRLFDRPQ
jgi:hydroxymethylbilane synthase